MAEPAIEPAQHQGERATVFAGPGDQQGAPSSPTVTIGDIATYPTCPSRTEAAYGGPTDDVTKALQSGMHGARHLGFHLMGGLVDSPTALVSEWLNLPLTLMRSDFRFETGTPISKLLTCDPEDLAAAQASQHHGEKIWPVVAMAYSALEMAAETVVTVGRGIHPSRPGEARPVQQNKPADATDIRPQPQSEPAAATISPVPAARLPVLEWAARDAEAIANERALSRLAEKVSRAPTQFKAKFLQAIDHANRSVVRQHSRTIADSTEKVDFVWEYTEKGMELTLWGLRGVVTDTFAYRIHGNMCENTLFRRYLALREIPPRELVPPRELLPTQTTAPIAQAIAAPSTPVMTWLRDYVERFANWLKRDEPTPLSTGAPTAATAWPPVLASWEDLLANQAQLYRLGKLSLDGFENAVAAANTQLVKWVEIPIARSRGKIETARLSWEYGVRDGEVIIKATLTGPKNQQVGTTFKESNLTKLDERAKQLEKLYLQFADLW